MSPRQLPVVPPGTDVGGYRVEKKLGAGGFGAVYLAQRRGRLYALKLIPRWGLGEWAEREVAILLRLKHPNLVRIRGHGESQDESRPYFFIAMDYVEGRRLDVWAKAVNPSAREVVRKALGVARGLKVSHESKVVHRDLKESNIVVRASDGEAVLVDFGAGGYESAPSITGGVLPPGTPEYRAPEAWRFQQEHGDQPGVSYQPGPLDDLYALGVVLYWLLTGRQPFLPDEAEGVEAVLHRAPKPPHAVNPRVPKALGDVCMRLLAKRPEERPPSAEALRAELEALLAQADESWDVALCDSHGPDTATTLVEGPLADDDELVQWVKKAKARPRRGPRPRPAEDEQEDVAHEPAAKAELPMAEGARLPSMSVFAVPSPRVGAMRALRAAAWASLLVLLSAGVLVLASTLRPFPSPEPEHHVHFTLPTWAPGQEVATPWMRPEAHEATAPPKAASTPAAVAVRATFTKDKASVKMKKNTGTPPPPEQPNEVGSVGKALGLGLAVCMGLACPGPQVRPAPPPEDCPSGAAAAMDKLGIKTGATMLASFRLRMGESESAFIPVRAGSTTVRLYRPLGNLPGNTLVVGKLIVGEERVYGRFTEARTPQDERFPVCFQLLNEQDHAVGAKKEPNGGADAPTIFSEVELKAVRRFE